jgi:hypothetical protein
VVPKNYSWFHVEEALFLLKHKPEYIEHTNEDFESEKFLKKLRLKATQ